MFFPEFGLAGYCLFDPPSRGDEGGSGGVRIFDVNVCYGMGLADEQRSSSAVSGISAGESGDSSEVQGVPGLVGGSY